MEIPPDMPVEEFEQRAVAEYLAARKAGILGPCIPSERVRQFLAELDDRCTKAGVADPATARELIDELRREFAQ
jgi:hypothetical protein